MDYYELRQTSTAYSDEQMSDIEVAILGDMGFESFSQEGLTLCGYISTKEYEIYKEQIEEYISSLRDRGVECLFSFIKSTNWNALWESNFDPININGRCCVRAPFHEAPESGMDIVIMPKMSFGTGHHATTFLMIDMMLDNKTDGYGLDMGSGTGLLAIAAIKNGAQKMDAVDIDEWAYENTIENIASNNVSEAIDVFLGDKNVIRDVKYDFILANINRNILINDMDCYVSHLKDGGALYMSGFLKADSSDISDKAVSLGLKVEESREKDGWVVLRFLL